MDGLNPTLSFENGEALIEITEGGGHAWEVQFLQTGLQLKAGKTYKLVFDAKASAARDINVVFAADIGEASYDTNRKNGFLLTDEFQTFEFLFTFEDISGNPLKISFELGATENFAAGSVYLDNIFLFEAEIDEVLYNQDFTITGWRTYLVDYLGDNPEAEIVFEGGALKLLIKKVGAVANPWEIQIIQDAYALGIGPTMWVRSFSKRARLTASPSKPPLPSKAKSISLSVGWTDSIGCLTTSLLRKSSRKSLPNLQAMS